MFDNIIDQHLMKNNLFAFYLTPSRSQIESDLTFGYYDKTKFKGEMTWHPIIFKYMYGLQLDDIKMNGKSLGLCGPNGKQKDCIITVDSGTTFASLPGWAYNDITGKVPTLDHGVDCESEKDFGQFSWVINGKEYVMEANEWVYPPAFYSGNTPVLLQEEEKDFIQLGQYNMVDNQSPPKGMSLAQTSSSSEEQSVIGQKLK